MYCHQCGHRIETDRHIGRQDHCPECGAPLHCCLNCQFHDSHAHWQCLETEIERVDDKASGNFCEYFKPSGRYHSPNPRREAAKKKLDDLFGNKAP